MRDVIAKVGNEYAKDKCPKCKRTVMQLISITDDGGGKRYCRDCKRMIKQKYPERDYRKVPKENGI